MKKIYILPLIFLLVVMSGCYELHETLELKICGAYAVPGMLHFDLKGNETSCSVIERDSEGRILFEWSGNNFLSNEKTTYLVICQGIDQNAVYYYEDVCYIVKTDTAEEITNLKKINGWDEPISQERISYRPKKASFDLYIVPNRVLSRNDVNSAFENATGIAINKDYEFILLDISPSGQELYCAKSISAKTEEVILFVVSSSTECTVLNIMPYEINGTIIAELKSQANWRYGANE